MAFICIGNLQPKNAGHDAAVSFNDFFRGQETGEKLNAARAGSGLRSGVGCLTKIFQNIVGNAVC